MLNQKTIKSISIQTVIWEMAEKLAKEQNRSISNLIEYLILEETKKVEGVK